MVRGGWCWWGVPSVSENNQGNLGGTISSLVSSPTSNSWSVQGSFCGEKTLSAFRRGWSRTKEAGTQRGSGKQSAATGRGATQRRGWALRGAGRGSYPWREDPGLEGDPGSRRAGFRGVVTINALGHFSSRDSQILISTAQHPRVQMHRKFPQQSDHPAHHTGTAHLQP